MPESYNPIKMARKVTALCLAGMVIYPQIDSKVALYYKENSPIETLISQCPSLHVPFRPTFWLFNSPLQVFFWATQGTLSGKSRYCDDIEYTRTRLNLPDGGLMTIDWTIPNEATDKTKILIICPGITGNSGSQYVRFLAIQARDKGFRVGVIQGRGIGGVRLEVIPN